jgi:enhancing lycopene biosynthesis protein 2
MLITTPATVRFDTLLLDDVTLIAIESSAERAVVEWSDFGPHITFADVPEQRITVKVVRRIARGDLAALAPGQLGELSFVVSPAGTAAAAKKHAAQCVVLGVRYDLAGSAAGKQPGAMQVIELVAISSSGSTEPFAVTDV